MIVRDAGDAWEIVLQPDHALLSGQLARAWGNERFATPTPLGPVVTAATRHDDGWAIWERAPTLLEIDGVPKPRTFLDVQIPLHLAFYRAHIAAIGDEDPYAELLVSMHGRGIYNGRYGTDPMLRLTFADDDQRAIDAFVAEQEARQEALRAALVPDEDELWANYLLLQVFDRLSLHFCMKDPSREASTLGPIPVADGEATELRIQPDGPWRVTMDPYPFGESPATFTLLRRTVPKRAWPDHEAFRETFFATPVQETEIVVSPQ
jgi:hypothetical protein